MLWESNQGHIHVGGKRTNDSPDGKRSPPPMDICNTKGHRDALPAFKFNEEIRINMTEKVAIVTGANKGLGFAVVKALCQNYEGSIYLTARDKDRGVAAVKKLEELGLRPKFHLLDVSKSESVKKFADFIKTTHGGVDVFINNAGILIWDQIYPSYEVAKNTIDINYRSLLTIEEHIFPLLRDGAKVVNVSSIMGHLSNLKNQSWINKLLDKNITVDVINGIVDNYLESIRNGTFEKGDFADDGKHAEYKVSKIAVNALTFLQQRKYLSRNISINAYHPGYMITDMALRKGHLDPDDSAKVVMYLVKEVPKNLDGMFMKPDPTLVDWYDAETDYVIRNLW